MNLLPGRLRAVRPGLHAVETRVDDFDVRACVVEGAERVLVWDTLAHPEQMAPVRTLVDGRRTIVAYSHADWDHVWGTAALGDVHQVLAHERCSRRFEAEVPEELDARRRTEPGRWDAVRLVAPDRTFTSRISVGLGDLTVVFSTLPGHTPDCAVAWIPAWGTLLAGDAVETPLPVINDPAAVPAWIEALRRWQAEPRLELVVAAHGRIGGREILDGTIAYLETLTTGEDPLVPADLDPFYARTHADNTRAMRGGDAQRV